MSGKRARAKRRAAEHSYLDRYLRAYMGALRRILKRRGIPEGASPPCHSCAFNPATDHWPGFAATVSGVMTSLEKVTPFVCHEHMPQGADGQWFLEPGKPMPPRCAGFEAVKGDPEVERAGLIATAQAGGAEAAPRTMRRIISQRIGRLVARRQGRMVPRGTSARGGPA